MIKNKNWESIENQIRQFISELDFAKAIELLKASALEKGNQILFQEILAFEKLYFSFEKQKKLGLLSPSEIESQENKWTYQLNYFIDCLQQGGATAGIELEEIKTADDTQPHKTKAKPPLSIDDAPASIKSAPIAIEKSKAKPKKIKEKPAQSTENGGILHNIPKNMQVGVQTQCIVRLAFDKKKLKKEGDNFSDEVIKDVKVSELMEVDLIDLSGDDAFIIKFVSENEQIIDKNEATEWLIMVKALKEGRFSLALKIAIIEHIDGKDRRKESILYETVAVVTSHVEPSNDFKSVDTTFQNVGVQTLLPNNNATEKTVLFMGANPPGTELLQLEIEHSRISVELEGKYRFPTAKFVSAAEIPRLFIIHKPNVVHFSGHGKAPSVKDGENDERGIGLPKDYDKTGGIVVFDNDMRGMKVIDDAVLGIIFTNTVQKLKIPIEVVVFNSCHSESQAVVVGKCVPYVIGTSQAIKDDVAIAFADGFYFGLANNMSIEDAFVNGKSQAVVEDLKADSLIVLYKNGEKMNL